MQFVTEDEKEEEEKEEEENIGIEQSIGPLTEDLPVEFGSEEEAE
jgi:hypothetical protein